MILYYLHYCDLGFVSSQSSCPRKRIDKPSLPFIPDRISRVHHRNESVSGHCRMLRKDIRMNGEGVAPEYGGT